MIVEDNNTQQTKHRPRQTRRAHKQVQNSSALIVVFSIVAIICTVILFLGLIFSLLDDHLNLHPANSESETLNTVKIIMLEDKVRSSPLLSEKWLTYALKKADFDIYRGSLQANTGEFNIKKLYATKTDIDEIDFSDHKVWLLANGIQTELAMQIWSQYQTANLCLLGLPADASADISWSELAVEFSQQRPPGKDLIMLQPSELVAPAASIFEIFSGEDSLLFEGYTTPIYDALTIKRSSDGRVLLAEISFNGWDLVNINPDVFAALVMMITNRSFALDNAAIDQDANHAATADLAETKEIIEAQTSRQLGEKIHFSLYWRWLLLPISVIIFIIAIFASGLVQNAILLADLQADRPSEIDSFRFSNINLLVSACLLLLLAAINITGMVYWLQSWWQILLILAISLGLSFVDAKRGQAFWQDKHKPAAGVIASIFWLLLLAYSSYKFIYTFFFLALSFSSLLWLFSGLLLFVAARVLARQLAAGGNKLLVSLLPSTIIMFLALFILI